jgi:hypothetical protein
MEYHPRAQQYQASAVKKQNKQNEQKPGAWSTIPEHNRRAPSKSKKNKIKKTWCMEYHPRAQQYQASAVKKRPPHLCKPRT